MSGTIRATTAHGDVVFNVRTGKVCMGNYRGIEGIDKLNVDATAINLGFTIDQLKAQGCELVHCTFTTKTGERHVGVPYPYRREQ